MLRAPFFLLALNLSNHLSSLSGVRVKPAPRSCSIIHIEDIHSDEWRLNQVVDLIKNGAIGIIPTDTCYSFVTSIGNKEGISKILRLKNEGLKKPLSVICGDISSISKYSSNLADQKWVYKTLKSALPGPYTFILPSSKEVPSILFDHKKNMRRWKRREIGVRIPDDPICAYIMRNLEEPLISGSVPEYGEDLNLMDFKDDSNEENDADEVYSSDDEVDGMVLTTNEANAWIATWTKNVDFIVDCGKRGESGRSTVVDLTTGEARVLRQGRGRYPVG